MEAIDYLKSKGRMCKKHYCGNCPLRCRDNIGVTGFQAQYSCAMLERDELSKAIEIVEKWAKENPVKTYLSVLLEKFPNAMLIHSDSDDEELIPTFCPKDVFNTKEREDGECPTFKCCDCWNREYEEE